MSSHIALEKSDGVARIILNRPELKNAMSVDMTMVTIGHLHALAEDDSTRVIVIEGRGSEFTSGGDMGDIGAILGQGGAERGKTFSKAAFDTAGPLMEAFQAVRQPVVVSMRGYAIGVGLQLVLLADLVVASETARFLAPQVKLAHTLDHGESIFLTRRIGLSRALQMTLLSETVSAETAEKYGLVNWVVPDGELEAKTDKVIAQLLAGAPIALQRNKALLHGGLTRNVPDQLLAESEELGVCAASADFEEAIKAFGEKRKPQFVGR